MTSSVETTARSISDSRWFEHAVRIGLVAYGVVHALIGWLGLQLAFGDPGGSPSQQGALHTLAEQPGGELLLWLTGFGLILLAVWQASEVLWGHTREEGAKRAFQRLGSAGRAVVYAALGVWSLKTAAGSASSTNEDSLTRRLLELPAGQLIVAGVGAVIIVVAILTRRNHPSE